MTANGLLWAYIVLLVAGGAMGYFKAGSKVSLIASLAFAVPLALAAAGFLGNAAVFGLDFGKRSSVVFRVQDVLILALLIVFAVRFGKGGKWMPSGLMAVVSLAVLVLRLAVLK